MSRTYFNLRPRYGCGSPGMVHDENLARRVAAGEREFYQHHLEGAYGEEKRAWAEKTGLRGIVEEAFERNGGWVVHDLITDARFFRERKLAKKVRLHDVLTRYVPDERGEVEERHTVTSVMLFPDAVHVWLDDPTAFPIVLRPFSEVTTESKLKEGW